MRINFTSWIICSMTILLLSSCSGKKGNGFFTPVSTGRAYELLVVVKPNIWEGAAGHALNDILRTDVPGLPQAESSFKVMHTSPNNFDATLKIVRNIIIVDINPQLYTQPKFKVEKNLYAAPQTILTIQSPNDKDFEQYIVEHKQNIIDLFDHAEMNRQISLLKDNHNIMVEDSVKKMFGCDVWIPGELASYKIGKNFFWAGTNAATGDENFVIYSFPYRDKNTFTKQYFIHKRDSVMKINIPGAAEGMYMTTQDSIFTDVRPISVKGEYAFEARGLWMVKGDMMGGPYVSHMRYDKKNHRIVVAEVFVYAPEKKKRNLIKKMEASLYTLRMPDQDENTDEISLTKGDVQNKNK